MDTDFEFDYTLKREGFNYIKDLIESVKVYMIAGIKLAHQGKVTKEQFWEGLFIKEGTGWDGFRGEPTNREPLKYPTKKENPENCPEDPYMTLDFQATNKYLYYGGDRVVSWNGTKPVFAQDSYLYFKYFGIKPFYRKDFGKKVPKTDYEQLLDKAIGLRNFSYHENLAAEEEITPASMAEKITLLKGLTKELERKKGWIAQSPLLTDRQFPELKEFWEERDSTYKRLFGAPHGSGRGPVPSL